MHLSNVDPIPTFIGTEQPEVCRACGVRTDFIVLSVERQVHECPNCENIYFLEFEADFMGRAI
mgnify:CR=1 FL=1|jgi:hypothetical protein